MKLLNKQNKSILPEMKEQQKVVINILNRNI